MKKIFPAVAQLVVLILAFHSNASHSTIMHVQASGSGWCTYLYALERDDCNNTDTSVLANTFTGKLPSSNQLPLEVFRSWFAFELPVWSHITGATISIWNDALNVNDDHPNAIFHLHRAIAISLEGLTNGPSIGSMLATAADGPSRYIDIELNSAGVHALNSRLGAQIILGGNNDSGGRLFGSTTGNPTPYLTLRSSELTTAPTLAFIVLALFALSLNGNKTRN